MKRLFFIFAVTLCVLTACRSNRDRLIEINGFLNDNRLDTAQICLNMINPSDLSSYDEALYYLATVKLNHLNYRPLASDTLIRSCINVFTKYDDKERLAESLYYKAVTDYEEGRVPQAFTEMKKAEEVAKDIDDLSIRHKIIESLTDWNMSEHQYQLAMNYGKQNLALSTMADNKNWIAYALVFISQIHDGMGRRDSAKFYLDKCITYMKHVPDSQRVDFYNYIAAVAMKANLPTAYSYAMKGNAIRPNSVGYVTLAKIRHQEGDYEAVDSLCEKAYDLAINPGERKFVYQQIMHIYEKQKRYDKAMRASMAYMDAWDTEAKLREEHDVRNVQASYDYEMKALRISQNTTLAILAAIILVLVFGLILIILRFRNDRTFKEYKQSKLLLDKLIQESKELEAEKRELEARILKLTDCLANFNERYPEILYEGRKLYDHIMNGGTTAGWGDDDFFNFVQFYRIIDQSFVAHLEDDYDDLSPQNMMFMILYHMEKDDKEVAKIIGIAEDSLRMKKSRLRRKDNSGALE